MALRRLREALGRLLRRPLLLLAVLLGMGGLAVAGVHGWAWYHFFKGRADLERYHAKDALDHFNKCLKVWPGSADVHFLASRAARREAAEEHHEDKEAAEQSLAAAEEHLRECQRLRGGASEETAFEWALLHASAGDLPSTEPFLRQRLREQPQDAPLVLEALAEGYLRMYRILDALGCLDQWLHDDPDNVRALLLKGNLFWQVKAPLKAIPEYRRVLELDAEQHEVRWRLARCLLDVGRNDEALTLLEQVRKRRPDDPEVLVRIARCQNLLGRSPQARELLDAVLAREPDNGAALRTRGEIALLKGDIEDAERWLRRAVRVLPDDYQTNWALHRALTEGGKVDEARRQGARARELEQRLERLAEIGTRKLSERPHDPALHCEMGELLLVMGHKELGERWLLSALEQDPRYRPAHAALAKLYAAKGDKEKAEYHRLRAAP
ncbi:MAG: tetratricopeptide repeat protein [Planctomycetes bacterium]|nr:tetratricopeptide repeat protein [Planctomycetota bacterium]